MRPVSLAGSANLFCPCRWRIVLAHWNSCPYVSALMSAPLGRYLRTSLLATITYVAWECGTKYCVLVPSFPCLTRAGGRFLIWRPHRRRPDQAFVLEGDEVAVEADENVDRALPRLRLRPDAVDELRRSGDRREDRVDVPVEAPEDESPNTLLLGDRSELAEEGGDVSGSRLGTGACPPCRQKASRSERPARHRRLAEQRSPIERLLPAEAVVPLVAHLTPSVRCSMVHCRPRQA